mmetsp:Transcript_24095/g.55643  ORF Transcript_24095/g.55643 Transcript_24095/m.55643 type:complete len:222 (-) Transcript_24095:97-762(-)
MPAIHELRTGNMETQMEWHEAFRDHAANMYRTSYSDMVKGNEVHVRADFPSGYGGHDPPHRHDILFRNTGFDRVYHALRSHPMRDTLPAFDEQKSGLPSVTKFPRGARRPPSAAGMGKTIGHVTPPWGTTLPVGAPLTFRARPPTTPRAAQSLTPRSARPATSSDMTRNPFRSAAEQSTVGSWPPLSARETRTLGLDAPDAASKASTLTEATARRSIRFSD